MSHSTSARKNKQQKHPKVYFQQYLIDSEEPWDDSSHDTPAELEAELLENSHFMRRRFRRMANMLRS